MLTIGDRSKHFVVEVMASNNMMNLFGKLEKYNGKDDLKSWIQKFNRICAIAQKTDDAMKGQIVMLCLEGQALAVAEQLEYELEGAQSFTQVKDRLESVFNTTAGRESKMCAFENRFQRVEETEDEFMLSLVQLYRCANPDATDQEFQKAVKRKFLQGIPPKLRRAIFIFNNDPYVATVTYQNLLEFARTAKLNIVDTVPEEAPPVVDSVTESNSSGELLQAISKLNDSLSEQLSLSREQGAAINTLISSNRNRGRGRGRARGYWRNNQRRPNNQDSNQRTPVRCFKCQGLNHVASNCLQKN